VAIGVTVATIVEGDTQNGNAQNGKAQEQYALGQNGLPHPVPDGGSTAGLLGLSAVLVVLAQRKFAIAK
jgi:VPDSG-CTERM motif